MDYEIKTNYRFNGELTDGEFNNVIMSVMNYAEKQALGRNQKVVFKHYDEYRGYRERLEHYLHQEKALCGLNTKRTLVFYVIDMIICMPTPHMRKKVMNYLNSQIALYCYNKRPYTNQIPNYPYKSKNIADLLEEVEQVNNARMASGLSRRCHCK